MRHARALLVMLALLAACGAPPATATNPPPQPSPTAALIAQPSPTAVPSPTLVPTVAPTVAPTAVPTAVPTVAPTAPPTPTRAPVATAGSSVDRIGPPVAPSPTPPGSSKPTPPVGGKPTAAPAGAGPLSPAERQNLDAINKQADEAGAALTKMGDLLQNIQLTEAWGRELGTVLGQLRAIDAASMRLQPPTPRTEAIHRQWRAITTEIGLASYDVENGLKAALAGEARAIGIFEDVQGRMKRVTDQMPAIAEQIKALERAG